MADEVQYGSGTDSAIPGNKRKYDDPPSPSPPAARRPTGFSAPIAVSSPELGNPPSSFNGVSTPSDEIMQAKQRAQEIAARIFSSASNNEQKRPRVENVVGLDSGSATDPKSYFSGAQAGSAPSAIPVSYNFQGTSKKIDIPNGRVGVIIGKGGDTIKYLQQQSGAKIQVTRDMDADPNSPTRNVELMGTPEQIAKAEKLIEDVLNEAEAGGSGIVSRRVTGQVGADHIVMRIPNNKVGLVIGKGGETIKTMQMRTGARIQVIPLHLPPGDTSAERSVHIDGTNEQIESAKQLVEEVISENRPRNSTMTGSYPQQGYQARPPTNWGNPAPQMQQAAYGYGQQPGAYPGPATQYNMSQPAYGGYPQQQSGGYSSSGWDQSTVPPNQQTAPGSGYDYYGQQAAPLQQQQGHNGPAPTDNSGYNYNQPPASGYPQGQGYPQDGYGSGYHATAPQSGYGQPNSHSGYDQQQGYNSAPAYGSMTNPTQDGHTTSYGAQGDNAQAPQIQPTAMGQGYSSSQQPSPNPGGYPSQQGVTQQGYGMPPTSQAAYGNQPPAYGAAYGQPPTQKAPTSQPPYGQSQQSPTTQAGYTQSAPAQPGYPPSQQPPAQSGYTQPDSAGQRAPPSSYGAVAAQPGYAVPPYGAAPTAQQPYGQQPAYNSGSYASGYSQPPVYPADTNSAGATPAATQPVAKASPQN